MGRLNQLLDTLRPAERTWCCDRCRAAAHAPEQALDDKNAGQHDQAQEDEDKIGQGGPDVIERRS